MGELELYIDYLETQVKNHSIYVWGAQGQNAPTITEAWIKSRETSTANAERAIDFWKKQVAAGYGNMLRAFDCSGLAMYYLQNINGIYKSDMSANTLKSKCTMINKSNLQRGDWTFRVYTSGSNKGQAYHIGYVVNDALNTIEAKGRDYGVIKRSLNGSGTSYWNAFGRPSLFADEINSSFDSYTWTVSRVLKLVSPTLRGDDVKELQKRLSEKRYAVGTADGIFGSKTEAAVRAYQQTNGLTADGKAGKNTIVSLGGVFNG